MVRSLAISLWSVPLRRCARNVFVQSKSVDNYQRQNSNQSMKSAIHRYDEEEEEEEVEESEGEDDDTSEGTSSSDDEAEASAQDKEELGADEFKVDEVRIEGLPEPAEGVPSEVCILLCILQSLAWLMKSHNKKMKVLNRACP